jgi:hypothetical protein
MASIENNSLVPKRKADAFVNVTVVSSKDKEQKKNLGGIPLYADNAFHALILEQIAKGGKVIFDTDVHVVETEVKFNF